VTLGILNPVCPDDPPVTLMPLVQFPTLFNGTWTSPSKPESVVNGEFYPNLAGTGTHFLRYQVQDALGCKNARQLSVLVMQAPNVVLRDTFRICRNETQLALNQLRISAPVGGTTMDWFEADNHSAIQNNLDESTPSNAFLKLQGAVPAGIYKMVLKVELQSNGCAAYDTCILVIQEIPVAEAGTLSPICFGDPSFNLFTASGASPGGGIWTSAATIQAPATFNPASIDPSKEFIGDQIWFYYTRSNGNCQATDSVSLTIKPKPQLNFPVDSLCIGPQAVDLNTLVSPGGTGSSWTGTAVNGSQWDIAQAGKGWHSLRYDFLSSNGCSNTINGNIYLELPPQLEATIPDDVCEGEDLAVEATYAETSVIRWETNGDGVFDGGNSFSTQARTNYQAGLSDIQNGNVLIRVRTLQGSVCPEVEVAKNVRVYPLPLPEIRVMPDEGCQPLTVQIDAIGLVPVSSLYTWNFGEGNDVSGVDLMSGINHDYLQSGNYQITLRVRTPLSEGACEAEAEPVTIQVYPKPDAAIDADKWVTTVNFPGIQFYDRTRIGGADYIQFWEWTFGDPNNGVSSLKDPFYEYPILSETDSVFYRVGL
ncbi:MAG: PKD domain-containing protein, partial [Bacteroidota bacterium]|nr:PKD domain-containing protein [Bacteroidota bacterium]MDX5430425.1 PKD domain-containing protein [Bacteroidota bacterium]MDX5469184.1 PKD domain-containing protein [Bacteroidota bacterium]